jgi:predicted phage tail protein
MTERDPASTNGGAADATSAEPTISSGAPGDPVAVAPTSPAGSAGLRSRNGRRNAPVAVRPVRAPISGLRQKIDSTAALRESLDAKEAEAQDLRASIDQLRQELDVERTVPLSGGGGGAGTTDTVAEAESRRGRPWWVLMLGAAVVALLLLLLASRFGAGSPDSTTANAGASARSSGVASVEPSAVAPSEVTASGAKVSPMAWPGGVAVLVPPDLPTKGPGLDAPGAHVTFALDDDGRSFDSYEQLKRDAPTTEPLYLSLPSLPRTPQPAVAGLQVELDGVPVTPAANPDGGWIVTSPGNKPYTTAVIRYKLTSATVVSRPGRGDSVVVALSGQSAPKITFHTSDKRVILMSCQLANSGEELDPSCQQVSGTDRSATIDSSLRAAVSLSVDLPK